MIFDLNLSRAADILVKRYGADAPIIAARRVDMSANSLRVVASRVPTALGCGVVALLLVIMSAESPFVPGAIARSMPEDMTAITLTAAMAADARRDYVAEHDLLLPLAQEGFPIAQYDFGILYAKGEGVSIDYGEAVGWFRKAADQGLAPAQYAMGLAYAHGQGLPVNDAQAVDWLRRAAQQGYALAQTALNHGCEWSCGVFPGYHRKEFVRRNDRPNRGRHRKGMVRSVQPARNV